MLKEEMSAFKARIEEDLERRFCDDVPQKTLLEAMRYSLLAGGKRLRPMLTLAFCRLCGGDEEKAMPFAAAIEMVHTYSLIHDDLPCMDNDDYRRGRLTNHKVFGEATAVLAGDALLTAAFSALSSAELDAQKIAAGVALLAGCAGELGMVGGQMLDLEGEKKSPDADGVLQIHERKTGALIKAACCLGVIAAGGGEKQMQSAGAYAEALGLAFQIRDDMLDVIGDSTVLGKQTHHDAEKNTFVALYGLETCEKMVREQTEKAICALEGLGDTTFLCELARELAGREK